MARSGRFSTSSLMRASNLALKNPAYHFKRIGLEAGPLSQWLCSALAEAELPVTQNLQLSTSRRPITPWSDGKTGRYDPRGRIDQLAS